MPVRGTKPASPIREDLKELQRPIAPAGSSLLSAATPQDAFRLIGAGRKNLIINGDFRVSQRGDYTTSAVTAGHDSYWLDRWMSLKDGTTSTIQRVTRTINGVNRNAARIECTVASSGATGVFGFAQRIELQNIPVGEFLTVSCWVRTNHPFAGFRTNTFRGFGGDAPFKFNPDGSWNRVSWTFNSANTISSAPDILIVAYNGNTGVNISAGQYIEIADVQLEVGKVATPFEYRSYAEELQLCQRYYEKSFDDNIAPSNGANSTSFSNEYGLCVGWAGHRSNYPAGGYPGRSVYARFKVTKRAVPSVQLYGNSSGLPWIWTTSGQWVTTGWGTYANKEGFEMANEFTGAFPTWAFSHWAASAEL